MLARWLDRGLGQILAPDENAKPPIPEAKASFWQIVAPDPAWEALHISEGEEYDIEGGGGSDYDEQQSRRQNQLQQQERLRRQGSVPPPVEAFSLSSPPPFVVPNEVVCQHCHHVTPVVVGPSTPRVHEITTMTETQTNKSDAKPSGSVSFMSPLEKEVLAAARGTTQSLLSPTYVTDVRNKVFRLCASGKPLQEKLLDRLRSMFLNDPSLLSCRASSMGNLVPDGFTPLMATAYVNQLEAAKIILELDQAQNEENNTKANMTKSHVDLQGRTALHIAAEMGSLDVAKLLQSKDTMGAGAPVDLMGHTPLGRAVTSHQKSAKRSQSQLSQVLFSPGDASVTGIPTPLKQRTLVSRSSSSSMTTTTTSTVPTTSVPVGFAQMPGFRIHMEDALSIHSWEGHVLVGVCDGHGDDGQVSTLVADKIQEVYHSVQSTASSTSESTAMVVKQQWTNTCLALDKLVLESGKIGGSTGVWAMITESTITTINLGDCRCILIQQQDVDDTLSTKMDQLQVEEGVEGIKEELPSSPAAMTPEVTTTSTTSIPSVTKSASSIVVKALTTDHKPDSLEERLRVEKAGLSVIDETFYDEQNGMKCSIAKIELAEGHRMAVARAFGDFEYKSNPTHRPEDQAVCATPDVEVYTRTDKDMYLVLACDGIWDVMSNENVCDFVVSKTQKALAEEESNVLPHVGDLLLEECLNRGSRDNLSVVLVALSATAPQISKSGTLQGKTLCY